MKSGGDSVIMAYIGGIAYKLAADYTISEQAANKIASNIFILIGTSLIAPSVKPSFEIYSSKSPLTSISQKRFTVLPRRAGGVCERRVVLHQ